VRKNLSEPVAATGPKLSEETHGAPATAGPSSAAEALEALASRSPLTFPILVVVAHPDDETLGAGAALPFLSNATFVHLTDGAPCDPARPDALADPERLRYARTRREELEAALDLAGLGTAQRVELGIVDQQAAEALVAVAGTLAALLEARRFSLVLTHAYEGGHPDHDAAAFAVHAAVALHARAAPRPFLVEMPLYHAEGGALVTARFLPGPWPERVVPLSSDERARKARLLACFASQREALAPFRIEDERYRIAPPYDFRLPPHAGTLHYERMGWRLTGKEFRARASAAAVALAIGPLPWR
jgi:N-acetylglucosamine malate deacetylase 2